VTPKRFLGSNCWNVNLTKIFIHKITVNNFSKNNGQKYFKFQNSEFSVIFFLHVLVQKQVSSKTFYFPKILTSHQLTIDNKRKSTCVPFEAKILRQTDKIKLKLLFFKSILHQKGSRRGNLIIYVISSVEKKNFPMNAYFFAVASDAGVKKINLHFLFESPLQHRISDSLK